jgi:L-lactate dehydrogenase complex protein LldE
MKITLFAPCFMDAMFPDVAMNAVKIFESLGHQVDAPEELACCGQPAFNTGYWDEARNVASKVVERLCDVEALVLPSGSCTAMIHKFYPELFKGHPLEEKANRLAAHTWEFSDFLVTRLGVTDLGASFPARVTFHDGCHGLRELGIHDQPRALLSHVRGLTLIEMEKVQCCGFGGTFSAKFPSISSSMGESKVAMVIKTGAEYVVSNDSSCLMHIQGVADKQRKLIKSIHLIDLLVRHE